VGVGFLSAPAKFGGAVAAAFGVLFTLIGGHLLLAERLTGRQWAGACCALAGLAILALTAETTASLWPFILGGLLWASYSLAFCKSGLSALEAVTSVALLAALVYLPFYFLIAGGRMWSVDPAQLALQAIGQGVLTGIVALWFHARAVANLGAMKAALFQSLVPALTLIIAFLALGERPTATDIVAISVILAGIYGALRYGEDRKAR
jgi:drug/metabolite transporter (DMT)-like permease